MRRTMVRGCGPWLTGSLRSAPSLVGQRVRLVVESDASMEARNSAAAFAKRAEDSLSEVRRQTIALEQLAAATRAEPLVIEQVDSVSSRLRNTTDQEIAIERLENQSQFGWKIFVGPLPVVIQPNDAAEVVLFDLLERPTPAALQLRIRGRDDLLRVPLRRP